AILSNDCLRISPITFLTMAASATAIMIQRSHECAYNRICTSFLHVETSRIFPEGLRFMCSTLPRIPIVGQGQVDCNTWLRGVLDSQIRPVGHGPSWIDP